MVRNGADPGIGHGRRAEQLFFLFQFLHHELARRAGPIDVPLGRLVANVQKQRRLGLIPADRELVLLGEMADAAEIEDHDRLQRMLADGSQRAVVDNLYQAKKHRHGGHEHDGRSLPAKLIGPDRISGEQRRRDKCIRAQQDAKAAQRKRERLKRQARNGAAPDGNKSDRTGQQPGDRKQDVAPDDPGEDESRRRQRQQRKQHGKQNRPPGERKCQCSEGQPIGRDDQQEHAARPRRDRIDQPPQHGHRRRLPVAQHAFGDVLEDVFCVIGHDARIEDQQRQSIAGEDQRADRETCWPNICAVTR